MHIEHTTLPLPRVPSLLLPALLLCLAAFAAAPALAAPPVFTVGHDAQACDFTDLGQALWLAPEDARIEIAAGTYFFDRISFGDASVWISGGHDGCGGDVLPEGRSILDGNKTDQIMDLLAVAPTTVVLQRLELRNGRGRPVGDGPAKGAGLRVIGPVQLLLTEVVFRNNITFYGGALALTSSNAGAPDVTLRKSQLLYNRAITNDSPFPGLGGAIHCKESTLAIDRSTLANNAAIRDGGAIYADLCSIAVTRSQFDDNRAFRSGGAIFESRGQLDLGLNHGAAGNGEVSLKGNRAQQGGALSSVESRANVDGALFTSNSADLGGALHAINSQLTLGGPPCAPDGCVRFVGNQAEGSGGAMALVTSSANIFGAVAQGNTTLGHGAFLWAQANEAGWDVDILSSVLTGGNGKSQIHTRTLGKVRVLSSTIFDNPSQQRPMLDLDDKESHVSHVIFSGNEGAPTRQDPDVFTCNLIDGPFAPPANSMLTILEAPTFVAEGDHHLQAGSQGVDVCPFGMFEAATFDLDGDPRPDAMRFSDIGADEVVN